MLKLKVDMRKVSDKPVSRGVPDVNLETKKKACSHKPAQGSNTGIPIATATRQDGSTQRKKRKPSSTDTKIDGSRRKVSKIHDGQMNDIYNSAKPAGSACSPVFEPCVTNTSITEDLGHRDSRHEDGLREAVKENARKEDKGVADKKIKHTDGYADRMWGGRVVVDLVDAARESLKDAIFTSEAAFPHDIKYPFGEDDAGSPHHIKYPFDDAAIPRLMEHGETIPHEGQAWDYAYVAAEDVWVVVFYDADAGWMYMWKGNGLEYTTHDLAALKTKASSKGQEANRCRKATRQWSKMSGMEPHLGSRSDPS